jgi:hypothetical protein
MRKELDSISHGVSGKLSANPHEAPELLANGVSLLPSHDDAGVLAPRLKPLLVQSLIIPRIVRIERIPSRRRTDQVLEVIAVDEAGFRRRQNAETTRPERQDQIGSIASSSR